MSDALRIEHLACRIGPAEILRDVTCTVRDGSYTAIIGPNGAGKTTLLRCLIRAVHASGTVTLFGQPLADYRQRDLAKNVGYVAQMGDNAWPYAVRDFVLLSRYPHLSPFTSIGSDDRAIADVALARTGMTDFAERALHTLSGGERQKVFIAAALAQGARLLLLDEPTTFLDYKHQVEVAALLRRLNREEGVTVVAVTHDLNHALRLADHVVALKEGRTVFEGAPGTTLSVDTLMDLYGAAFRRYMSEDGVAYLAPVEQES